MTTTGYTPKLQDDNFEAFVNYIGGTSEPGPASETPSRQEIFAAALARADGRAAQLVKALADLTNYPGEDPYVVPPHVLEFLDDHPEFDVELMGVAEKIAQGPQRLHLVITSGGPDVDVVDRGDPIVVTVLGYGPLKHV